MKKITHLLVHYRQLSLALATIIIGLPLDLYGFHTAAHWLLGLVALGSAVPLVWSMVQDVRDGTYGIDILAATAIIASVWLGEYWTAMIIVVMLTGGEALEHHAEHRARSELTALLNNAPKRAHLLKGHKQSDILASAVKVNDKLLIKPGELVPVDAVVIDGQADIDESSLTGESLPINRRPGDTLLSGSINLDGSLTVKALRVAADSQYEQIIKLVKSASSNQSPFVRLADRYSIPFTIIAYLIAIGVWVQSGQAIRFLEVIVVATPCPLLLAAPIAIISGMSRAAKHGIIMKTGSALEKLAAVRTMAFDKTGTLTIGQPTVRGVTSFNGFSKNQVLAAAASLEQNSNHVLAEAVVQYAKAQSVQLAKVKNIKETAGSGLQGLYNHQTVLIGRANWLSQSGITLPKNVVSHKETNTFVAIDGKLAGTIQFADALRPESKTTLDRLNQMGIEHTLLITGDNTATAQSIAKQLGISDIQANCLPADKITALQAVTDRPVGFVGDGVNDAPVLTAADVGIALGARGAAAASESADIVIMHDNLGRVATALAIAKRTLSVARQSILIGIFISIGLMLVFATGRFKPIYGAFLQELVDVTVIFYALRAHGPWRTADPLAN